MPHPALLIIDVQTALADAGDGRRNNPGAEATMARLLAAWRERRWPVIHVRHDSTEPDSPLRPGAPGHAIRDEVRPLDGEPLFHKTVNSAFIGTDLEAHLREAGIEPLVVVGLTTDHCVSTSVRMAANLGFDVTLVADATATFERQGPGGEYFSAETLHAVNLASLDGEFCRVVEAETLLRPEP